jgi:hypothetical protein
MIGGAKKSMKVRRQPKTIEDFYKARGKDPEKFYINEQGDLVASAVKEGETDKIFTLPKYRRPTQKEAEEADQERRTKIVAAEAEVQEAQRVLREKLEAYRMGEAYASDVVLANIDVEKKEKQLQALAYPLRSIEQIASITTNEILLDERYEVRKFPYPVHVLKHSPFPLQDMYVREGMAPEEEVAPPPVDEGASASAAPAAPMTAADRGRLGGIIKLRRKKATFAQ